MKQIATLLLLLLGGCLSLQAQLSAFYMGTYKTGVFDDGATEIVAYVESTQRLFSVNGSTGNVDMIDLSNPGIPTLISSISLSTFGDHANSVAAHGSHVAVAVEANNTQSNGQVVFFDSVGNVVSQVTVGALPDMVTFTHNGSHVLVANEGEPDDDYLVDPEGSVSIIDVSGGIANVTQANVQTASFSTFQPQNLDPSIRIFGPNATVAMDLEPEYIAVSSDNATAYAVCQENNAIAVIDIATANVTALLGLGFKDHNLAGNGFDASNDADLVDIKNWPVFGMYQPDAIDLYTIAGQDYIISANEGDSRDYDGFSEEDRVRDLTLDATAFPNATFLQNDTNLGRLQITTTLGDSNNDGEYEELYCYGGRSWSIWNATTGALVWDSGNEIEQLVLTNESTHFNSNNDDNDSFKARSDDKGPEPEAIEYALINGRHFAFIGLERQSAILAYEITNPAAPVFTTYITNRNYSVDADDSLAGDLGVEGLLYIPASQSPTFSHLLVSANEVSGTISIWELDPLFINVDEPAVRTIQVYPNPVGNTLHIDRPAYICIHNVMGQILFMGEGDVFDVSSLASGVYYLRTQDGAVRRFVKE